jgi:hypothetical protein
MWGVIMGSTRIGKFTEFAMMIFGEDMGITPAD